MTPYAKALQHMVEANEAITRARVELINGIGIIVASDLSPEKLLEAKRMLANTDAIRTHLQDVFRDIHHFQLGVPAS